MARRLSKEEHEKRIKIVIELRDKYNLTFDQIAARMALHQRTVGRIYYEFRKKNMKRRKKSDRLQLEKNCCLPIYFIAIYYCFLLIFIDFLV